MQIISERVMFLLTDELRSKEGGSRPPIKVVLVSGDKDWLQDSFNWVHDLFAPKLKTMPTISQVAPNTRACPLVMNHPNCLVLIQDVDNSDAIQDFGEKNKK